MQAHSASGRLIWLSHDTDNGIVPVEQCLQRRHGEFRRAHEDEAKRLGRVDERQMGNLSGSGKF
jgi:hypothetical protein